MPFFGRPTLVSWWPEERHKREGLVTKDYAESLKEVDDSPLNLKPYMQLMDVAGRSFNAEEEKSYFDKYRECGVYYEALKPRPYTVGAIWADCGDNDVLVHQKRSLRYREWKGNVTVAMDGIQNLRTLLREDTALARTELLKHSGEITMIPHRNEKHRFYVAEGSWDLLGRDPIVDRRRQYGDWRLRMVAGVRFELTTFGL